MRTTASILLIVGLAAAACALPPSLLLARTEMEALIWIVVPASVAVALWALVVARTGAPVRALQGAYIAFVAAFVLAVSYALASAGPWQVRAVLVLGMAGLGGVYAMLCGAMLAGAVQRFVPHEF